MTSALNEGRGINPGDTSVARAVPPVWSPLNEGRGINPGDTVRQCPVLTSPPSAQRRPGHQPRRHPDHRAGGGGAAWWPLNEGRGINPGDTFQNGSLTAPSVPRTIDRSTKAGASTPATRDRAGGGGDGWWPLNEGRGINPGDTFQNGSLVTVGNIATLNEGRGINPGDTRTWRQLHRW